MLERSARGGRLNAPVGPTAETPGTWPFQGAVEGGL